jgi:4-hydroxybenzoate polyprenyltransferase
VFIVTLLVIVFLVAMALVGREAGLGWWYKGSLVAAGLLFARQYLMIRKRHPQRCFAAFLQNRHVGATVFAGIALHYLFAQT